MGESDVEDPLAPWCIPCGYSLAGLSDGSPCPECGTAPTPGRLFLKGSLIRGAQVRPGYLLLTLLLLGATVYIISLENRAPARIGLSGDIQILLGGTLLLLTLASGWVTLEGLPTRGSADQLTIGIDEWVLRSGERVTKQEWKRGDYFLFTRESERTLMFSLRGPDGVRFALRLRDLPAVRKRVFEYFKTGPGVEHPVRLHTLQDMVPDA